MTSPNHHDESIRRMSQAQALMESNDLDALLLFSGPNMAYFTCSGLFGGRSGSRPYVFVLPRKGHPALVVHDGRQYESRKLGGIDDVLTYSSLSRLPLEQVLRALASRGVQSGRIGLELGMEMVLDLPHAEFQRLRDALPQAEFIDASPLLWKCRMIKTEVEIDCVRRACEITSEA